MSRPSDNEIRVVSITKGFPILPTQTTIDVNGVDSGDVDEDTQTQFDMPIGTYGPSGLIGHPGIPGVSHPDELETTVNPYVVHCVEHQSTNDVTKDYADDNAGYNVRHVSGNTQPQPQPVSNQSDEAMMNQNPTISDMHNHRSAITILSAEDRAEQQQVSENTGTINTNQPNPIDLSEPELQASLVNNGFCDLEIANFRFFIVLDMNTTFEEAQGLKEHMVNFNGKTDVVSLFNPFRRRVTRKGKVVYPGGYLHSVIPEVVSRLTSIGQSKAYIFAPDPTLVSEAINHFLSSISNYILNKIDHVVSLDAPVYTYPNGDSWNVSDLVTTDSWVSMESGYDTQGDPDPDVSVLTLNSALRVIVPELIAKKDADAMVSFVNSVYSVLINTLDDAGAAYADIVLAMSTNSAAFFSNPAMSDFVQDLVTAVSDDGTELDEDEEASDEADNLFDFDVMGFSMLSLKDNIEQGNTDHIFPTEVDTLYHVFGNKAEMVFMTYISADDDDDDFYEDEDDGDDEDGEAPDSTVSNTSTKRSKSKIDQEIENIDLMIKKELEKSLASKKGTVVPPSKSASSKKEEVIIMSEDSDPDEIEEDMDDEEGDIDDDINDATDDDIDDDIDEDMDDDVDEDDDIDEIEEEPVVKKVIAAQVKQPLRPSNRGDERQVQMPKKTTMHLGNVRNQSNTRLPRR